MPQVLPESPATESIRYHGLDALRAGAMLLGVVLHVALYFQETAAASDPIWPIRDVQRSPLAGPLVIAIHIFRMPLFFVMAGFFIGLLHDRRGTRGVVINRFRRIGIPFVIGWCVLFPLVKIAFSFAYMLGEGLDLSAAAGFAVGTVLAEGVWADPAPIHLWFLYYLLMLYVGMLVLGLGLHLVPPLRRRIDAWVRNVMTSRSRLPILVGVTFGLLTLMDGPTADTPDTFEPQIRVLLYYGFYLLVGWALWNNRSLVADLHRWSGLRTLAGTILLGITSIMTIGWFVVVFEGEGPESSQAIVLFYATQVAVAATCWILILGLVGVAERILRRPRPVIRYLVDASYWIYLIHLPLSVFIPALFRDWAIDGTLKMMLMMALVVIPCLLTWEALRGILPRSAKRSQASPAKQESAGLPEAR